ncbi:uncharacterized protein LOC113562841 [Ooceraea biroi]|uniref:uncharacterized protein LOC113562841 n=1 Tax=Ooceraea biroi TaxID=2015173 RepID=UPI000F0830FB|nr:uncharacterized protein LOC113562841 [Ooceraea biroi]
MRHDMNIEEDELSSSSSCVSDVSDISSVSCTNSCEPLLFRERLASCFVSNNLTHVQGNSILSVLRTHPCFSDLPKDVRTLLNTPRNPAVISNVEPGEYIHFDLEAILIENVSVVPFVSTIKELKLDFNTDGCNLDKSGTVHIWPIQCRIVNIQCTKPIVIGIYKGSQKPHDANIFFEKFVADIIRIISNGGIICCGNKIPIRLRSFIADAPARAFILNHRSHVSTCSKCKVCGVYTEGRVVFSGIDHAPRTDEEYNRCLDEDHHKDGKSALSSLPMGMVSQVPFEYMHLVCLGVVKKLLSAWIHGKYSRLSKLSARSISIICERLNILRVYCPSDFARRPRSLDVYSKFKATEFRQFLLYTGPVVMYGLLDERVYKHFLFLHAAIRVLVSKSPSSQHLRFAELALQKFILRCKSLYGPTFHTYNVHGLVHLTDDVERLGSLDSFSAFPYENNMSMFRKYCRKLGQPLQQFFNRMAEKRVHDVSDNRQVDSSIRASMSHNNDGSNRLQYRKIQFNGISLSTDERDNCCILHDGSICIVCNVVVENNAYRLAVKKFLEIHNNFYDVGMESSAFRVYKCATLSNELFYIDLDKVNAKCYRMPFWNCTSIDNVGENHLETLQYIVAAIIHSEQL